VWPEGSFPHLTISVFGTKSITSHDEGNMNMPQPVSRVLSDPQKYWNRQSSSQEEKPQGIRINHTKCKDPLRANNLPINLYRQQAVTPQIIDALKNTVAAGQEK
jgi:hypothetical protein